MQHRYVVAAFTLSALVLAFGPVVQADTVVGTQGFADIGSPTADGSTTGNIHTATLFTIDQPVSTSSNTGVLAGMPSQSDFGTISFDITNGTSLTFGDAVFGSFASTSIAKFTQLNVVIFYVLGNWTPGSYGNPNPVAGGPFSSSMTITYNQDSSGGAISDSATFSVPPANPPVPEPSSALLGLTALVGGGLVYRHRRRRI